MTPPTAPPTPPFLTPSLAMSTVAPPPLDTRKLLAELRDTLAARGTPTVRLNKVVRKIAEAAQADVCSLYLKRAGEVLELFATIGLNPKAVHTTRLHVGEGLIGTVADTAMPLAIDDAPLHPQYVYRPETDEESFHAFCAVPLVRNGKVLGVLAIQHHEIQSYDADTIETLQTVAMVLAELVASNEFVASTEARLRTDEAFLPGRLTGTPLNPGLATGRAVLYISDLKVERLVSDNPSQESRRLAEALSALHASLDDLLVKTGNTERDEVLTAYRMFAADRGWIGRMNEAIRTGLTAEAAVLHVGEQIKTRLGGSNDAYLLDRLSDFDDLSRRLLTHLIGKEPLQDLPDDAVLVARHLGPAELLDIPANKLRAVILEEGSTTSHVTIVARALGLPVIGQCSGALTRIEDGDELLVDADNGQVLLRPMEEIRSSFEAAMTLRAQQSLQSAEVRELPTVTADGIGISLNLNCGLLIDLPQLTATRADGIGLYRTEMAFMARSSFPDVKTQTGIYKRVLDLAEGRPVTFRTLDIGGDKFLPYMNHPVETNPALGWRAIRIGLDRPQLLRQQLRALLLAGAGKRLRIMFPMLTNVAEFHASKALLEMEKARLIAKGGVLPESVEVGAMLEVPALLFQLPALLQAVDFLSVGSNDLLQFALAADRSNRELTERYDVLSPPVLTMLGEVAARCKEAGKPLTLCGEIAGKPLEAMVLLGLGYRSLSLSAPSIDEVKLMIRSLTLGQLKLFMKSLIGSSERTLRPLILAFARDHGVFIGHFRH